MKQLMYFFALFIAVVMTACSSKDDFAQDTTPKPIVIKASIQGMDTKTRSTGDAAALQNTEFAEGAKINVYLREYSTSPYPNIPGVPADPGFIVYENNSGTWNPATETTPTQQLLRPVNYELQTYGIYPSKDINGNYITIDTREFTVGQNQALDEYYRKSDLMFSGLLAWDRFDDIKLSFTHRLTKITIVVDATEVMTESEFKNNVSWIGCRAKRTAQLNENFIVTGVNGDDDWICSWSKVGDDAYNSSSVSCIIPPQTINETDDFISIDLFDTEFYYKAPSGGLTLQAGKEYKFTIKLANKNLVLGTPTISDWITEEKTGTAD